VFIQALLYTVWGFLPSWETSYTFPGCCNTDTQKSMACSRLNSPLLWNRTLLHHSLPTIGTSNPILRYRLCYYYNFCLYPTAIGAQASILLSVLIETFSFSWTQGLGLKTHCCRSFHLFLGLLASRLPLGRDWKASLGKRLLLILSRWSNQIFWYSFMSSVRLWSSNG
jgi:hypothetical protein